MLLQVPLLLFLLLPISVAKLCFLSWYSQIYQIGSTLPGAVVDPGKNGLDKQYLRNSVIWVSFAFKVRLRKAKLSEFTLQAKSKAHLLETELLTLSWFKKQNRKSDHFLLQSAVLLIVKWIPSCQQVSLTSLVPQEHPCR